MTTYPVLEHAHSINGVPGRMFTVHEPQLVRGRLVYRNQTWKSQARPIKGYGTNGQMTVTIRFDDECQNGHQSFSITADVVTAESRRQRDIAAGGCLHEDVAAIFPELAPLVKWHLMDTDGPMHYPGNALCHASDADCYGRRAGEPSSWDTVIFFGNSPVSHTIGSKFAAFLEERRNTGDFQIIELAHPDHGKPGVYQFTPNYTFAGYGEQWHGAPFKNRTTAEQWQRACNTGKYRIDRIPAAYSEGKARDLEAARSCAVWPEATDEQLTLPRADLEALLTARLPGLIAEFKADMERIGFLWEPDQPTAKGPTP